MIIKYIFLLFYQLSISQIIWKIIKKSAPWGYNCLYKKRKYYILDYWKKIFTPNLRAIGGNHLSIILSQYFANGIKLLLLVLSQSSRNWRINISPINCHFIAIIFIHLLFCHYLAIVGIKVPNIDNIIIYYYIFYW